MNTLGKHITQRLGLGNTAQTQVPANPVATSHGTVIAARFSLVGTCLGTIRRPGCQPCRAHRRCSLKADNSGLVRRLAACRLALPPGDHLAQARRDEQERRRHANNTGLLAHEERSCLWGMHYTMILSDFGESPPPALDFQA